MFTYDQRCPDTLGTECVAALCLSRLVNALLRLAMLCNAQQRYPYEDLATLSNAMLACAYLCLTMLGYAMLRHGMLSYATLAMLWLVYA